jgi:hypothetical protein
MTDTPPEALLYARLEVMFPAAKAILVADATGDVDCEGVARNLTRFLCDRGRKARVLEVKSQATGQSGGVEDWRSLFAGFDGYTVVVGEGVLNDPATILAATACDAVVIVCRRGRTARADLERTRSRLDEAGARLAAGFLLP